jgi:hypothetical protein
MVYNQLSDLTPKLDLRDDVGVLEEKALGLSGSAATSSNQSEETRN